MLTIDQHEFWFVVGSQALYGPEALAEVKKNATKIVQELNETGSLPYPVKFKTLATTREEITRVMKEANYQDEVAGVITWMHTFSPAKMWITGTQLLQKPLCHLATQFREDIPWSTIDMDYMNVNQSAHGDREYGYINARLQKHNKIIYGWWGDERVQNELADWMNVAVAYNESFKIKVARFGDNMRDVAVTEGDKIEAEIKFGWQVDYFGIGDLVAEMKAVSDAEVASEFHELDKKFILKRGDNDQAFYEDHVKEQLRITIALRRFLARGHYTAFTTNFEDLWGMKQLPGLAVQLLNAEGYGFAGEGDWKTAALDRLLKIATHNRLTGFMEDYTIDFREGHHQILGSHMLEVDPTLASTQPSVEVHPLGIGNREDPARLVFDGSEGDGLDVTMADFGTDFKLIMYPIKAMVPEQPAPHLPVARQLWLPKAGLVKGSHDWIENGGGHHTVLSLALKPQQMLDLAQLFDVKIVNI